MGSHGPWSWRCMGSIGWIAPWGPQAPTAAFLGRRLRDWVCDEDFFRFVFGWPGDDLLSQVLRHSTIGAEAFDGRVRDGIGSGHFARATRPAKDKTVSDRRSMRLRGWDRPDFRSKMGFQIIIADFSDER